ncbi:hypothetical protein HMPREF3126_09200 [Salmonella sp. HMSC13B08]|nr:hypothetical protein HMPREF3126_09200 [Salmonella sp. HMSC13B08]
MRCVAFWSNCAHLSFNIGDPSNNIENFYVLWGLFNISEVLNNIESCKYQRVTFSILVIKVLFPN